MIRCIDGPKTGDLIAGEKTLCSSPVNQVTECDVSALATPKEDGGFKRTASPAGPFGSTLFTNANGFFISPSVAAVAESTSIGVEEGEVGVGWVGAARAWWRAASIWAMMDFTGRMRA